MDWFLFQFVQNLIAITISFVISYHQQRQFAFYFLIWIVLLLSWSVGFSLWKLKFDKADSKVGSAYSDAISNIFIVKSFAASLR